MLLNITNKEYFPTILRKAIYRLKEMRSNQKRKEIINWCEKNCEDILIFAKSLNIDLWNEAQRFEKKLKKHANSILSSLNVNLGGGSYCSLIYFLIRLKKPKTIVETGVAAGFSTQTILSAINKNGHGFLFSSDFPYFRIKDPERYIGCIVDQKLKDNWRLYIKGDKRNIQEIMSKIDKVDFLHYDSDKSYSGRKYVFNILKSKLDSDYIIMMDDIQDNAFFKNYTEKNEVLFRIFKYNNKFLGLIGI